ncbi:protein MICRORCHIDIA 7 isoform X1 [Populus alba]|uniref:protein MICRORCHIDIA 7 isoform X1 n=1 Tax=Populus alba TaxID=43335 RepID=UPI001589D1DA|nr:protein MICRORCHIDIA 7-like isoform X1 [Populus alba]
MGGNVKREILEQLPNRRNAAVSGVPPAVIELSSSSESSSGSRSESESEMDGNSVISKRPRGSSGVNGGTEKKKRRKRRRNFEDLGVVLPLGFLAPITPPPDSETPSEAEMMAVESTECRKVSLTGQSSKQFWKAGDYEGAPRANWDSSFGGMDHVRVHPKFLHSNATSHKWALGAFAELLDNALDEFGNGARFVNIDVVESKKDQSRMLLIEDNGGGMDPDKLRQCMSLGYSAKSKVANTIGQYGNGFKTSTMRLGADVIVFSRCQGKDGKFPTHSIGLLSYTFLRSTGKEDIVVPMLDYERKGREWSRMVRSSTGDWNRNVETIVHWSPFSSEADLLRQFKLMSDHGTRIIIYNLWEDDQGMLELDFDSDPHDIQLRGVNRDEKHIQMAKEFPNSRHFLTYRHSLRNYTSILYRRLPSSFRIILRGKDVEHHNIVNDMMLSQEITYRPQPGADSVPKDTNQMTAVVTIGFVKDAKHHIDVQGFNVYHKNRLIKPFWRLWNAAGSDGRGVIGVLEANFIEPAHDKQGFERTTVLARLEARLVQMQKHYWCTFCHKIGYAPRRNKKLINESDRVVFPNEENSPDDLPPTSSQSKKKYTSLSSKISPSHSNRGYVNGNAFNKGNIRTKTPTKLGKNTVSSGPSPPAQDESGEDDERVALPMREANGSAQETTPTNKSFDKNGLPKMWSSSYLEDSGSQQDCMSGGATVQIGTRSQPKVGDVDKRDHALPESDMHVLAHLKQENRELKERLQKLEGETRWKCMGGLQCEKCKSLEIQLQEAQQKLEELNKEQESLIDIFSEERDRRDQEEESLRKKLKDASNTIQELLDKVRLLDKR